MSQKMAWFSNAKPDLANEFDTFNVTLLNNKHTYKELLISLRNDNNSNKAIRFLASEFKLIEEVYSPDFSYK